MKNIQYNNRKSLQRISKFKIKRSFLRNDFYKNKSKKRKIAFQINKKKYMIKILLLIYFAIKFYCFNEKIKEGNFYNLSLEQKMYDYNHKKFGLIHRIDCPFCGLFSSYIVSLGCIYKYLNEGYIPIIDFQSFGNTLNPCPNTSLFNPWELFFYQPFNYTFEEVKKYAKNVQYLKCHSYIYKPNEINIFFDNSSIIFWHKFAKKYMPVKKVILNEVNKIMKYLFGNSKNILGVKIRGTDYRLKPTGHFVQPEVEQVIKDVKIYDEKYKYDYIFFATEDEEIKTKFIPEFKDKIKLLDPGDSIMETYNNKGYRRYEHLNYVKNYVLNVIILSKCLDIIASKNSGAIGMIIMTEGFRNSLFYDLGVY